MDRTHLKGFQLLLSASIRGMLKRLQRPTLLLLAFPACSSVQNEKQSKPTQAPGCRIPGGTMATALIRSTVGATARAPFASTWIGAVMLKDRTHALVHGLVPGKGLNSSQSPGLPGQAGGPEFEAYLDRQGLPAMTSGSVKLFVDGKSYFPELIREINAAKARVDIQTYIFDNDSFAIHIADILKRKSLQVPVRVYMDALGNQMAGAKTPASQGNAPSAGPAIHHYLRQGSKIHARRFLNPWLVGDHVKLHLIDQNIAYVGGMNIGWEYKQDWHDMMVRMEGPVAHDLADVFESGWRSADWKRNWGLNWNKPPGKIPLPEERDFSREIPLRILMTEPSIGKREILAATLIAVRSASRRVWIESPYFASDNITDELEKAVRRGVDVRVIVPGDNDSGIMDIVNAASLGNYVAAGGKLYAYPGVTHLKAAVFDDWATFGSANSDTLSVRINRELNLASSHPRLVEGLVQQVFLPDFRKSKRMTTQDLERISSNPAAKIVGDQL